jgi:hypothetical protein
VERPDFSYAPPPRDGRPAIAALLLLCAAGLGVFAFFLYGGYTPAPRSRPATAQEKAASDAALAKAAIPPPPVKPLKLTPAERRKRLAELKKNLARVTGETGRLIGLTTLAEDIILPMPADDDALSPSDEASGSSGKPAVWLDLHTPPPSPRPLLSSPLSADPTERAASGRPDAAILTGDIENCLRRLDTDAPPLSADAYALGLPELGEKLRLLSDVSAAHTQSTRSYFITAKPEAKATMRKARVAFASLATDCTVLVEAAQKSEPPR